MTRIKTTVQFVSSKSDMSIQFGHLFYKINAFCLLCLRKSNAIAEVHNKKNKGWSYTSIDMAKCPRNVMQIFSC